MRRRGGGRLLLVYVNSIALGIAVALLAPMAVLLVQLAAAMLLPRRCGAGGRPAGVRVAVLVPAHNEEASLGDALETIRLQLRDGDRIVVIADNCTDRTCEVAAAHGAQVIHRNDLTHIGKAFAFEHGVRHLEADPPDVVVVIDADCAAEADTLDALAGQVMATDRPAQAVYVMNCSDRPALCEAVSALAFLIRNEVRPMGMRRLGLPCLVTGSGMAFPWHVIRDVSPANEWLAEDTHLSVELSLAGYPPLLCEAARVSGQVPRATAALTTQRRRWEYGHLSTMVTQVPRLMWAAVRKRRPALVAIALDLAVPPLALLVLGVMAGASLTLAAAAAGASRWPVLLLSGALLALGAMMVIVWARVARGRLPLVSLLAVPVYLAWKVPLYLTLLVRRPVWSRTARDARLPVGTG
mgnify:CR=1 FL=1